MKIIAIGDIHGRDTWKKVDIDAFDKVVFIGDYVDSRILSAPIIIHNFKEIIAFKKALPDKVVLLLGNHDIQYLFYPDFPNGGLMENSQKELTELFVSNRDLFQMAYQVKNYLFTHAGVSCNWYNEHVKYFESNPTAVGDVLNAMYFDHKEYDALFEASHLRSGSDRFGGIVWADKLETQNDFLAGYHQIVGHTKVPKIERHDGAGDDSSITYIDILSVSETFYELEIWKY